MLNELEDYNWAWRMVHPLFLHPPHQIILLPPLFLGFNNGLEIRMNIFLSFYGAEDRPQDLPHVNKHALYHWVTFSAQEQECLHGVVIIIKPYYKILGQELSSCYFLKVILLHIITMLLAKASWMTPDESVATCSPSRFCSTPLMDCSRLSILSWTLWDWAIAFWSKADRSAKLQERLWKRLHMESGKSSHEKKH